MLQEDLLASGTDPELAHEVGRAGLNMRADEHVGREVHEVMLYRPVFDDRAEFCDLFTVGARCIDDIAGIDLGMLFPKILKEPVRVIPGIKPTFHHEPEVLVCLVRFSEYKGDGPEQCGQDHVFEIDPQAL